MRSALTAAALLATGLAAAGCGSTIYSGASIPLVCADPTKPLVCPDEHACVAEDTAHCGLSCSPCSAGAHATARCENTDADLARHFCTVRCDDDTFVATGTGDCVCPGGKNVCGAETSCHVESVERCGAGCSPCPTPAHGTPSCTQGACGFTCDRTFVQVGNDCVCPPTQNACGSATACAAETASACGPNCAVCPDPPANANAIAACTAGVCGFDCKPGFRKDPSGSFCICDPGQNFCPALGDTTCQAQTTARCGPTCQVCPPPPAHATGEVCSPAGQCDFACDVANGFQKSVAGDACVCATGNVACGAGGTRCVPEGVTACGPTCATCAAPAAFPTATPICSSQGCDYVCPSSAPTKCTVGGQPSCCAAACASDQVACGTAGACVAEDAQHCGNGVASATSCITCPQPPPGATEVCNASTNHLCDFTCPAGTFKVVTPTPGCERVGGGPSDVAVGAGFTCAVTGTTRGVKCWGANDKGQLGDGTTADRLAPVQVLGLPAGATVHAIAAGQAHACAVLDDAAHPGEVWCWGSNATGQLGDAPAVLPSSSHAVHVAITADVTTALNPIAAGAGHTCVVNPLGGVACWGKNDVGQLGIGRADPLPSAAPLLTSIQAGAIALASGFDHTCAIVSGGAQCWGANDRGQIGNGAIAAAGVATPTAVATMTTGVGAIAVGHGHSCAVSAGNGPFCWGNNLELELGSRELNTPKPPFPNPPPGFTYLPQWSTPVSADKISGNQSTLVSAGANHTCGAKPLDAAAKCAGDSGTGGAPATGTLGTCPVDIGSAAGRSMVRMFGGGNHNCEVMSPLGTLTGPFDLWCWGVNDRGQLGNGATSAATTTSPVQPLPQ